MLLLARDADQIDPFFGVTISPRLHPRHTLDLTTSANET